MPRINIDDSLWADPRFLRLCIKLGSEVSAAGWVLIAIRQAQRHWCPDRKPIPGDQWEQLGFPEALLEVGFAKRVDGGVLLADIESRHLWWFELMDAKRVAGAIGGKVSAQRPRDERGRLLPNDIHLRHQADSKQAKHSKQASNEPQASKRSYSSSSSSSQDEEKKYEEPLASQVDTCVSPLEPERPEPAARGKRAPGRQLNMPIPTNRAVDPSAPPVDAGLGAQVFIGRYVQALRKRYGPKARPDLSGKVRGEMLRFLAEEPLERACDLIEAFVQMEDKWFLTKAHDFGTFIANRHKVALALDTGEADPSKRFKPTEEILAELDERDKRLRSAEEERTLTDPLVEQENFNLGDPRASGRGWQR